MVICKEILQVRKNNIYQKKISKKKIKFFGIFLKIL